MTVTCGRAAWPSGRGAPTGSTSASSSSGRERGSSPGDVRHRDVRRYGAALSSAGRGARHRGPQAGRDPRPLRLPRAQRADRAEPCRPRLQPEAGGEAPRLLCGEQVRELLERIPARTPLQLRDRAMFELAYSCGLRCEEIVYLDLDSFDFESEQLRVLGKGSKERLLPVGEPAQRALRRYLERGRHALAGDPRESALFLSKSGRRLSNSDVTRRLALWVREAALGGRRLAALAASQLRHPPARRRGRPAHDPGAARPRLDLDHAGLHSGRCRSPAGRVCSHPSSRMIGNVPPADPRIVQGPWKQA